MCIVARERPHAVEFVDRADLGGQRAGIGFLQRGGNYGGLRRVVDGEALIVGGLQAIRIPTQAGDDLQLATGQGDFVLQEQAAQGGVAFGKIPHRELRIREDGVGGGTSIEDGAKAVALFGRALLLRVTAPHDAMQCAAAGDQVFKRKAAAHNVLVEFGGEVAHAVVGPGGHARAGGGGAEARFERALEVVGALAVGIPLDGIDPLGGFVPGVLNGEARAVG